MTVVHHASPSCCDDSLDWVERAFLDVGLSGCLCYEVSDRNQPGEGIEENERFILKCKESDSGQMAALGGFASKMGLASGPAVAAVLLGDSNYPLVIAVAVAALLASLAAIILPAAIQDRDGYSLSLPRAGCHVTGRRFSYPCPGWRPAGLWQPGSPAMRRRPRR